MIETDRWSGFVWGDLCTQGYQLESYRWIMAKREKMNPALCQRNQSHSLDWKERPRKMSMKSSDTLCQHFGSRAQFNVSTMRYVNGALIKMLFGGDSQRRGDTDSLIEYLIDWTAIHSADAFAMAETTSGEVMKHLKTSNSLNVSSRE